MIWYELRGKYKGQWQRFLAGSSFNPKSVGKFRYRINGQFFTEYTPAMQIEVDKVKM